MGRVAARIIQMLQGSIDRCKIYDDQLIDKYFKIKNMIIKLINQKNKINLEEITLLIIDYSKNKLNGEIEKFKKLIIAMENGELYKLEEVYHPRPKKLINDQRKISTDKVKVSSLGKTDKTPHKDQHKN